MSDTSQYYKLASVVDNFLIESDLPGGWFNKCLVWAIRGLREIRLDTWQQVITKVLDVNDRNSVVLPSDFVDWAVVSGYHNGRLETFGVNTELDMQRAEPLRSTDIGYYLMNFNNGTIFSYGLAISTKGRFRVHDSGTCKELIMDLPANRSQIYLEYVSDGFDPCGETIIHPYLYDYLVKYMDARYEEKNNPKATEASIYRKGQEVYFAEKRIRARTNNIDPQTLLNLTRQYTTLALKL